MAMDFHMKDLYPNSGYVQTTEQTIPDAQEKAEIVDDTKAAAVANQATGKSVSGVKLAAAAVVVICLAVFLGASR